MPHLLYNSKFVKDEFPLSVYDFMDSFINSDQTHRPVVIVPTGRFVRLLKKRFVRKYFEIHGKPAENPNIFTISTFVNYCYGKYFPFAGGRFISDAYRMSLIEEAFGLCDLKFYVGRTDGKQDKPSPAIVEKIASIIKGLKEDGITPEHIKNELDLYRSGKLDKINGEITHENKLSDIYEIFNAYQNLLGDAYVDEEQKLLNLTKAVKSDISVSEHVLDELFPVNKTKTGLALDRYFSEDSIFYFYGFTEFKSPEVDFLSLFANSDSPVAINLDYTEYNGPLFGNLTDYVRKLSAAGFNDATILEDLPANYKAENDLNVSRSVYLRRLLFYSDREIRNESFYDSINIIAAETRLDEVRSIAKLIKWLHSDKGIALKDVCVCMRKPNSYTSMFREVFRLNEIPLNIADRYALDSSPLIASIFSVLDLSAKQWQREDIIKVASSAYFSKKIKDELNVDASNIYSLALNMKLESGFKRGGSKYWKNAFERSIQSSEKRIEYLQSNGDAEDTDINGVKTKIQNLTKALDDFNKLAELFDWESGSYSYADFNKKIKEKIEVLGLKNELIAHFDKTLDGLSGSDLADGVRKLEEVERDARAFEKFIGVLDELTSIAEERYPDSKIKLADFTAKLKTAVRAEKYQTREKPDFGVTVTAVEQIRQLPYKVFILCGAADGEFPVAYRTDTFLGKDLPDSEERFIKAEKTLFYQFLTANQAGLDSGETEFYIFYPALDGTKEITPSPFINALSKITTINLTASAAKNYPGYIPKFYNLENLRKAKLNTLSSSELEKELLNRIPWLDTISEKSEFVKTYTKFILKKISNLEFINEESAYFENIENIKNRLKLNDELRIIEEYLLNVKNPEYDGSINPEEFAFEFSIPESGLKKLNDFPNKEVSISALDSYAGCPFRYYVERILKIGSPEKETLTISPLETGSALHYVLYKFYTELQKEISDNPLQPVVLQKDKKDEYLARIKRIAATEKENLEKFGAYSGIEAETLFGSDETEGLIERWLNNELNKYEDFWPFHPALFEASFGYDFANKSSEKAIKFENGVKLRGRIDRVEINQTNKTFIIADYKTNLQNVPKDKDILELKKFQIPLYIKALQILLKNKYGLEYTAEGGVYYGLKKLNRGSKVFYQKTLFIDEKKFNKEAFDEAISNSINEAGIIVHKISRGLFSATPDTKNCQYCDFDTICGKLYEK